MLRRYRRWQKGEFVVVGADTSTGAGDYSTAQFISQTKIDVPLVYQSPRIASDMTPIVHHQLEEIFRITHVKPLVAFERNNGGVFEMERLAALNRNGMYTVFVMPNFGRTRNTTGQKLGWDTTTFTRPKMLTDLKNFVDNRVLKLYDLPTVNEFFSFINVQTSTAWKAQAEKNAHDDLIMALAIAVQLYQLASPPAPGLRQQDASVDPNAGLFDDRGFYA